MEQTNPVLIPLNLVTSAEASKLGLSPQAINTIFLGSEGEMPDSIPKSAPPWAKNFIKREFKAAEESYRSIARQTPFCPHPCSNIPIHQTSSFIPRVLFGMTTPVFKLFGSGDDRFFLAYTGITSRVTHIIIPNRSCVIYDFDRGGSVECWNACSFAADSFEGLKLGDRQVAIVDMVNSYAHQAMNHLSGIQRLIDTGVAGELDEILVSGKEFFGRTEEIFPELSGKISHLDTTEMRSQLANSAIRIHKIGSNIFSLKLRERILSNRIFQPTSLQPIDQRRPMLVVTVRSVGRRCLNLSDVIEEVVHQLLAQFPTLGVIIDGWVFPETEIIAMSNPTTALLQEKLDGVRGDAIVASHIAAKLPRGVLVANTIGTSILESLHMLQFGSVYFSPVGTLQHKLAWFTDMQGIVHGPVTEIKRLESSYFASEAGVPPVFMPVQDIVDCPESTSTPEAQYNYKVVRTNNIVGTLQELLVRSQMKVIE